MLTHTVLLELPLLLNVQKDLLGAQLLAVRARKCGAIWQQAARLVERLQGKRILLHL
jgi:hypothetical protein